MSVIRCKKDRQNPYVQINKSMFEDQNISLKTKGFIGYCLSKPDDWNFYVKQLISVLKENKAAIYSAISEAEEHGYCIKFQKRDEKGRMQHVEYIISDSKAEINRIREELKLSLPLTDFRLTENQPLLKNEATRVKNEITNYRKESEPDKSLVSGSFQLEKLKELEEIPDISESEKRTLYKKFTHEQILKGINAVNLATARNAFGLILRAIEGDWTKRETQEAKTKEAVNIVEQAKQYIQKIKQCPLRIELDKEMAYIYIGSAKSEFRLDSKSFKEDFCKSLNDLLKRNKK